MVQELIGVSKYTATRIQSYPRPGFSVKEKKKKTAIVAEKRQVCRCVDSLKGGDPKYIKFSSGNSYRGNTMLIENVK